MAKVRSPFTKAFNLTKPVVGCAMAGVAGPELAAAVARAGGLGFLGSGTPEFDLAQHSPVRLLSSPEYLLESGLLNL